ncbi:class I SAM-dependent methyltransferase [Wukongibacter baidiensis]|uniref:class I SAM-dependent methyltransferase n=1 Tax=Wukongibacter baidiensis TaxID=1723361 RepID=UPI003D7F7A38
MINMYDLDPHVSEVYDGIETQTHDFEWILHLLERYDCKEILEPYCGTGRIALPLAREGYKVTGIDSAEGMLQSFREKIKTEGNYAANNIEIYKSDFLSYDTERRYDAVLLGGNCLYIYGEPEIQGKVILKAKELVKPGGYIFIDNDAHDGELPKSWCNIGIESLGFPSGKCRDGTELKGYTTPTWVDAKGRFWKAKRRLEVYKDNEIVNEYEWFAKTHAVSSVEVKTWIKALGLEIVGQWSGTENINPLEKGSKRATFWVKKPE